MVHAKALARFAEQEGVAAALREMMEELKQDLETRAIEQGGMEELKQDLETRAIEQQGALRSERAEAEAQVKLLHVKVKGAVRAQRGIGAQLAAAVEQ
ncbi:hypothetical protein T484DRAFT_1808398, partial [Baffinella frigidus]